MLKIFFVGAVLALGLFFLKSESDPKKDFEISVKNIPKNSLGGSAYWYEMHGFTGWEKVILVFGYADNLDVCQYMIKIGRKDAPERDFKCTPAN